MTWVLLCNINRSQNKVLRQRTQMAGTGNLHEVWVGHFLANVHETTIGRDASLLVCRAGTHSNLHEILNVEQRSMSPLRYTLSQKIPSILETAVIFR